jgi:hypothetical protein
LGKIEGTDLTAPLNRQNFVGASHGPEFETFEKCSILFEFKEGEYFNVGMHLTPVTTRCSVLEYGGRLPTYIDGT